MLQWKNPTWLTILLMALSGTTIYSLPPTAKPVASQAASVDAVAAVAHANAHRASASVAPLTLDPALCTIAGQSADRMFAAARPSSDGIESWLWPKHPAARECTTQRPDAASAVASWLESPGNRPILLGPFTRVGVARSGPYWSFIVSP